MPKKEISKKENSEKQIYVLKLRPSLDEIFSESKEDILELWNLLSRKGFQELRSVYQFSLTEMERFYYPGDYKISISGKEVYIHENKDRAMKSKDAFEHAKKVGIISKKKKKS